MLFFSDVFSAAARRETMRGQETRELVGLGGWSVADPIDFTPDAGTGVLRPEFQEETPGSVLSSPGTGVLQPQYLTDPTAPVRTNTRGAAGAPLFSALPWLTPTGVLAGGALVIGLVLLGKKRP